MSKVVVNISKLTGAPAALRSLMTVPSAAPFEAMFTQWTARYAGFIRRRYVQNAAGGGDWAPLAVSTIKGRARGKGKGNAHTRRGGRGGRNTQRSFLARDTRRGGMLVASPGSYQILRDTNTLLASVDIGATANKLTRAAGRVTYTIAATRELGVIARAHQDGGKHLPQRKILVPPDAAVLSAMRSIAVRAVTTALKITGTP